MSLPNSGDPGPTTMANKKSAPARAMSLSSPKRSARDTLTFRSPKSILRKPSLPNLTSFNNSSAAVVPSIPSTAPIMSSPLAGSSTASMVSAFDFPPLPPLPPFPASANVQRKSAPPSTFANMGKYSSLGRARLRRSRVSFREDVEAVEEKPRRPRPTSHGNADPQVSPAQRPSADVDSAKVSAASTGTTVVAARPALKRAASSITRLRSASADTQTGDVDAFDAFRPQTLRYPRVSPALARLSDSGMHSAAEIWTSSLPRKTSHLSLMASPMTMSPVDMATPPASAPPPSNKPKDRGFESEREPQQLQQQQQQQQHDNRAGANATTTPARKKRTPRSPIPSWSSTCPSLTSSSHRASLASTLTAPSTTSLLLSPPSPEDRFPPPLPAWYTGYGAASPTGSPRLPHDDDTGDEVPELEVCAKVPSTGSASTTRRDSVQGSAGNVGSENNARLQAAARTGPRKSEPWSLPTGSTSLSSTPTTSTAPSSYSPIAVPRATERLLRLQNSLADMRMRKTTPPSSEPKKSRQPTGSSGERDAPRTGAVSASASSERVASTTPTGARGRSPRRPSSVQRVRSPSPTVAELAKSRLAREADDLLLASEDESDLDLSLPPLNAALRSRVIPSSSRLLVSMKKNAAGSLERNDGLGWSGSESEEEEFSRTVARIARRKSGFQTTQRKLHKRPSLPAGRLHRMSEHSGSSDGQTSSSGGPPTPFVAERPSTALGTRASNGTAALLSALVEQKYASRDALPRPKKFVGGWGAPEVLHEDDWPPDGLTSDDLDHDDDLLDDDHSSSAHTIATMTSAASAAAVVSKQAVPAATTRLPRPLAAEW